MSRRKRVPSSVRGYDESGRPLVAARVVPALPYYLLVIQCPFCGRGHTHGAGLPHEDPRDYAYHRWAHCVVKTPESQGGYVLVLDDEEPASKVT
jgi:hypothetical protein